MIRNTTLVSALTLALASCIAAPAFATGSSYEASTNGQVSCDPALPIYDTNLRQRPRAVVNESITGVSVFATCGTTYQQNSYGIEWYEVQLTNIGTTPKIINCTAVIGREGEATQFITKSNAVDANGGRGNIRWSGTPRFDTDIAVSCKLPDDTGISRTIVKFRHSN